LPGQYFDVESGWNHNGFRDYIPDLGRYAEPDPLGRLGSGNNLYAYVFDNPANLIDPLGLCSKKSCDELLNEMDNLVNSERTNANPSGFKGLAQRFRQMTRGYDDIGHLQQIANRQSQLQKLIDEYKDSGCGDPPSNVEDYANRPIASPWPRGSAPNFSPLQMPTWNPGQVPTWNPPNVPAPGTGVAVGAGGIVVIIIVLGFSWAGI
jgi:RHS repeat-associated protein